MSIFKKKGPQFIEVFDVELIAKPDNNKPDKIGIDSEEEVIRKKNKHAHKKNKRLKKLYAVSYLAVTRFFTLLDLLLLCFLPRLVPPSVFPSVLSPIPLFVSISVSSFIFLPVSLFLPTLISYLGFPVFDSYPMTILNSCPRFFALVSHLMTASISCPVVALVFCLRSFTFISYPVVVLVFCPMDTHISCLVVAFISCSRSSVLIFSPRFPAFFLPSMLSSGFSPLKKFK